MIQTCTKFQHIIWCTDEGDDNQWSAQNTKSSFENLSVGIYSEHHHNHHHDHGHHHHHDHHQKKQEWRANQGCNSTSLAQFAPNSAFQRQHIFELLMLKCIWWSPSSSPWFPYQAHHHHQWLSPSSSPWWHHPGHRAGANAIHWSKLTALLQGVPEKSVF